MRLVSRTDYTGPSAVCRGGLRRRRLPGPALNAVTPGCMPRCRLQVGPHSCWRVVSCRQRACPELVLPGHLRLKVNACACRQAQLSPGHILAWGSPADMLPTSCFVSLGAHLAHHRRSRLWRMQRFPAAHTLRLNAGRCYIGVPTSEMLILVRRSVCASNGIIRPLAP